MEIHPLQLSFCPNQRCGFSDPEHHDRIEIWDMAYFWYNGNTLPVVVPSPKKVQRVIPNNFNLLMTTCKFRNHAFLAIITIINYHNYHTHTPPKKLLRTHTNNKANLTSPKSDDPIGHERTIQTAVIQIGPKQPLAAL